MKHTQKKPSAFKRAFQIFLKAFEMPVKVFVPNPLHEAKARRNASIRSVFTEQEAKADANKVLGQFMLIVLVLSLVNLIIFSLS